jgi:hypothetical protein
MIKCTKCNITKEDKEFQTYFHSTQQVTRTRKVCTECFNEQKKQYKLKVKIELDPDKYYSSQPDYKKCNECLHWKTLDQFYKMRDGKSPKCSVCMTKLASEKRKKKVEEEGGLKRVSETPNVYYGDIQKEQTFQFLELMGYIYNEQYGIWEKPGYKEIIDGKVVFNYENKRQK